MQMKMPRLQDAHRGWPAVLQSAQCLFAGSFSSVRRICWFFSVVTFFCAAEDPADVRTWYDIAASATYELCNNALFLRLKKFGR